MRLPHRQQTHTTTHHRYTKASRVQHAGTLPLRRSTWKALLLRVFEQLSAKQ